MQKGQIFPRQNLAFLLSVARQAAVHEFIFGV
jgi:hypothetical protein